MRLRLGVGVMLGFENRTTCAKSRTEDLGEARQGPLRMDEVRARDLDYPFLVIQIPRSPAETIRPRKRLALVGF